MPMTPRQSDILDRARPHGRVMVEDLARLFGVTVPTIRRDLTEMCEGRPLERIHGGAVLPSGITNIGYEDRRRLNADAKEAIAWTCAAEIPRGASLFLNIGTTTEAVARALQGHSGLMVVTNNMNAAQILAANPSCDIVLTGGALRRSDGGLVGDLAVQTIHQFKVDFAVIGASALDAEGDLLDFDIQEVRVAHAILQQARQSILVADQGKLTRAALVRIASLGALGMWVTDAAPAAGLAALCADASTTIKIAEPGQ
jgi:DeoR family transcriptional regulator, glycerol-3-phosphate regulon repressor